MTQIAALVFDVFGTLVDFRSTIAREAQKLTGRSFDGGSFADAWRAEYQPSMQRVRAGNRGYVKLDVLHRENLDRILPRFGLDDLSGQQRDDLTMIWHRLDAWPDVVAGLARLRKQFRLAPMSNGHIALQVNLARHNGFVWDAILGAEIARDYKPKPAVYRAGAEAFGLRADQCLMVAAHSDDLAHAAEVGFLTAHIARPNEHGSGKGEAAPSVPVNYAARDLLHLAELLGA